MGLVKRTYVDGETVITADNLNDIQDEIIQNASDISEKGTYSKPTGGIPSTDMTTAVQTSLGKADTAYQKPSGGIPSTDLASAVQTSLGKADTAYQKPSGGIPSTDLASAVQTSLGKADTALQSSDIDNTLTVTGKAADAKKTGDEISDLKNTLNQFVRPNLLDNWYFFNPINQRGYSSYQNAGYCIDRWMKGTNGAINSIGTTYGLLVTPGTSLIQIFENGLKSSLNNRVCTVSVAVTSGSALNVYSGTFTYQSTPSSTITIIYNNSIRAEIGTDGRLYITWQASFNYGVAAVKLELGTGQTLAHQENGVWVLNEIQNYEEQLIRCKTSTADPSDTYAFNSITYNAPRPNLLDNWYFVYGKAINNDYSSNGTFPVNQRGQRTNSSGYHIDRWLTAGNGTTQINENGVLITATGAYSGLYQKTPMLNLFGEKVTFTALTSSGKFEKTITLPTSVPASNTPVFVEGDTSSVWFQCYAMPSGNFETGVYCANGNSTTVKAVKLELGSGQTLAHQENGVWVLNEIPNYQQELAKCQRYFYSTVHDTFIGQFYTNNAARLDLSLPVLMRDNPTVTINNTASIVVDVIGLGAKTFSTAFNQGSTSYRSINFDVSISESVTPYQKVVVRGITLYASADL